MSCHRLIVRNRDPGRLLALTALILLLSIADNSTGVAADASQGEKLARRWCAACHIVAEDQNHALDGVPSFAAIAQTPEIDATRLAQFLRDPHPKMPDMQLSVPETKDLAAYIISLKK